MSTGCIGPNGNMELRGYTAQGQQQILAQDTFNRS